MTDFFILSACSHTTSNSSSHYFSSGRYGRRIEDIEHFLSLSLSSFLSVSLSHLLSMCIDQIFWSSFSAVFLIDIYILSNWNAKEEKRDGRPDMCLRWIDKRRVNEKVFVYIYTLETNKEWHRMKMTDASRCVSWSAKDIVHVRRSSNGSFKNWLLPIRRRETSWIDQIKL